MSSPGKLRRQQVFLQELLGQNVIVYNVPHYHPLNTETIFITLVITFNIYVDVFTAARFYKCK